MYRGCKAALMLVSGQDDDVTVPDDDAEISDTRCGATASMRTAWSAEVLYTHGPPPAPMGLEALPAVSGDAITLTWAKSSDTGILPEDKGHDYRYRMSGADEFEAWMAGESPQRVANLTAGTMYMFEVRAVGMTSRRSSGQRRPNRPGRKDHGNSGRLPRPDALGSGGVASRSDAHRRRGVLHPAPSDRPTTHRVEGLNHARTDGQR